MAKGKVLFASTVATSIGLYLVRQWLQGCTCTCLDRLDGKTVLVTGGGEGIGRETAADLARRGARVIIAARNLTKLTEAAEYIRRTASSDNVVIKQLDLASLASVRAFAADIMASEASLHILINNAGVMRTPYTKTQDGFEMQFGVNHLGHFLLTNLLLGMLKASAPSRVVVVSSRAHFRCSLDFDDLMGDKGYDPGAAYCKSKLANVLFAKELANRLGGTGVTAYSLHPGVIGTGLQQHLPAYVRLLSNSFVGRFIQKTPEQGAQTTIHCAVCPDLEQSSGAYFSDCAVVEPSKAALDQDAATRLWMESERLVGLSSHKGE